MCLVVLSLDTWIPRYLNCLRYTEFTIRTFLICQALSSCIPKSHKKLLNLHTSCLTHRVSFVNGWTPKIWTDLGGFGSFICKPLGAILPWQAMAASHIPCWHVDHEFLYQQIVRYTLNDDTLSQQLHTFGGVASRAHRAKWDWEMSRISWSAASRQNHGMSQLNTGKTPRLQWSLANGIRDAMPCNEFRLNTYLSQTNPSVPTGMKSPDWSPSPVERWKYASKLS